MEDQDQRTLTMSEVMTPEKVNFSGNIHGGYILKLIDQVAYVCAARYSGHYVVTLSVDNVLFKQSIYVGELVTCYASINYVGRTSMEVGIKIIAENLITGEKRHTNSCYVTMVAVDEKDPTTAQTILKEAVAFLDKTASKGRMPKNTVARKKSTLTKHVNKLSAVK